MEHSGKNTTNDGYLIEVKKFMKNQNNQGIYSLNQITFLKLNFKADVCKR